MLRHRSTPLVLCGLLASVALAACGPTESTGGDEGTTAVDVGDELRAAGAPIKGPITDTTFASRWADYPGLTSDAETATRTLDLTIEVYETPADRRRASKLQDEIFAGKYSFLRAECGTVLVSAILGTGRARVAAQRREFGKVEKALEATFQPC
jgi:hypothetical protein